MDIATVARLLLFLLLRNRIMQNITQNVSSSYDALAACTSKQFKRQQLIATT
jgi:hypothetical protein